MVAAGETANTAIVLEDIAGIRYRLFRKGDGKGKRTGDTANGVAWAGETERQITCRTAWEGMPVIVLPENEAMGASSRHWRCAERSNSVRGTAGVPVTDSAQTGMSMRQ